MGYLYCNGMNKWQVEKWSRFVFGDFFKEVRPDREASMMEVIVNEFTRNENGDKVFFIDFFDKSYREHFASYWGAIPGFKLKIVKTVEEEEVVDE